MRRYIDLTDNKGGGGEVTVDSVLSTTSTNPVQNAVITNTINGYHENEIADGTIIEGKFSDLPTFFAGLEGKSCNGTVTYKITEDETLESNSVLTIAIPHNYCRHVCIDGNEKTITIPNNSSRTFSVQFTDGAISTSLINLLEVKNLNVVSQDTKNMGFSFWTTSNVFINACTFTGTGKNTSSNNGVYVSSINTSYVNSCEFKGLDAGLSIGGGNCKSSNNIFTNCNVAYNAYDGSIVRVGANTYTNVTTQRYTPQSFSNGIVYKT